MRLQLLSSRRRNRWNSYSRNRQIGKRYPYPVAWSRFLAFMTTRDQEAATIVTSLNRRGKTARTLLDALGVHRQNTTVAKQANRNVATVERIIQQHTKSAQNTGSNKKGLLTYIVTISTLNILQANLHKSSGVPNALYNHPDIWDFETLVQTSSLAKHQQQTRSRRHYSLQTQTEQEEVIA